MKYYCNILTTDDQHVNCIISLSLSFDRPGVLKDLKTMGSVSLFIFFITLLVLARQVSRILKLATTMLNMIYSIHYCSYSLHFLTCLFQRMSEIRVNLKFWLRLSSIWTCVKGCGSTCYLQMTCPAALPPSHLRSLHMKANLSWHRFGIHVLSILRIPSIISDPKTDVLDRKSFCTQNWGVPWEPQLVQTRPCVVLILGHCHQQAFVLETLCYCHVVVQAPIRGFRGFALPDAVWV